MQYSNSIHSLHSLSAIVWSDAISVPFFNARQSYPNGHGTHHHSATTLGYSTSAECNEKRNKTCISKNAFSSLKPHFGKAVLKLPLEAFNKKVGIKKECTRSRCHIILISNFQHQILFAHFQVVGRQKVLQENSRNIPFVIVVA